MSSTALNTVCLLPGKDVTIKCALPDSIAVWSSPHLGKQEIHSNMTNGVLGSAIELQHDSFELNLNTSYICTRARAIILNIEKELNGLELTCSTINHAECQSIFSSTFMVNVIGKHF